MHMRHGGFGAPVVKFTQIDDRFGVLVGGRGGWIINGSFVVGGGGYGLANQANFEHVTNASGDRGRLAMGYGGHELTYVLRPDELVHVSLGVLIGAGGVVWNPLAPSGDQDDDPLFITEPERASSRALLRVSLSFIMLPPCLLIVTMSQRCKAGSRAVPDVLVVARRRGVRDDMWGQPPRPLQAMPDRSRRRIPLAFA
jgi:hypothetical protein